MISVRYYKYYVGRCLLNVFELCYWLRLHHYHVADDDDDNDDDSYSWAWSYLKLLCVVAGCVQFRWHGMAIIAFYSNYAPAVLALIHFQWNSVHTKYIMLSMHCKCFSSLCMCVWNVFFLLLLFFGGHKTQHNEWRGSYFSLLFLCIFLLVNFTCLSVWLLILDNDQKYSSTITC